MQNLKVLLGTLLVVLFVGGTSFAQPVVQLEEGRQNDLLTVRITDLHKKYATVKITDLDGKVWLSKQLWNKEAYTAGFDLTDLSDGDYLVSVKSKGEQVVKPFTRKGMDLIFLQPKEMQTSQPEVRRVSNQPRTGQLIVRINPADDARAVNLQLANLPGSSTTVGLISTNGIPVISEEVKEHKGYAMRFNMTGLSGQYILYVKTDDVSIMQFLTVEKNKVELLHALSREKRSGESVLVASR